MKKIIILAILAACGDNIGPDPDPDPSVDIGPEGLDPDRFPGHEDDSEDGLLPDAGVHRPEECKDSHIYVNGHEHKCQHDMDLPSVP